MHFQIFDVLDSMGQLFDILVNCITSFMERGLRNTNDGTLTFCDLHPPSLL